VIARGVISPARRGAFLALGLLCAAGCGVASLQTARTVPRGETRTTVAASLVHTSDRGFAADGIPILPLDLMVRHGASERVDWGVRLFFGLGLLGDVKWNLLPTQSRSALSISAGVGAAATPTTSTMAGIVQVPVTVTASRELRPWFTPYAALGYGSSWIFNYTQHDPSLRYAARTWTGDGLAMLHVGIALARASGRALLLEYTYARPVVDDPGDGYKFATNQFFSIAFRTGSGATFAR
jgi:hypothetical protein